MYRDVVDIMEQAGDRVHTLLVPKVGVPADLYMVEAMVNQIEQGTGVQTRVGLEALIETALGMANVEAIAQFGGRLECLHFGVADYAASMRARTVNIGGLNPDYPGDQWHASITRMVIACRAYGLRAVDGPFGDFSDPEGYKAAARRAAALGCEGKVGDPPQPDRAGQRGLQPARGGGDEGRAHHRGTEEGRGGGQGRGQPRRQDDRRGLREDGPQRDRHGQGDRREGVTRRVGDPPTMARKVGGSPTLREEDEDHGHSRTSGQGHPGDVRRAGAERRPRLLAGAGRLPGAQLGFPCVVKAQIHSGGRGEVGGVKVCKTEAEVRDYAAELLGKTLVTKQTGAGGKVVHRLWVEEATDIAQEIYLGFVLDRKSERIMIVASGHGGMEIEDLAHEDPDSLVRMVIDPATGLVEFQARELAVPPRALGQADRPDGRQRCAPVTGPTATSTR
jgi:hypothetical protein